MSMYSLRDVNRDDLQRFRALCHKHNLKPEDVLKHFIRSASIAYRIATDSVIIRYDRELSLDEIDNVSVVQ